MDNSSSLKSPLTAAHAGDSSESPGKYPGRVRPQTALEIGGRCSSSTADDQPITFSKRLATANIKGQLCKIALSMYFLLQAQIKKKAGRIEGFHLASNVDEAGEFKDVVFRYRYRDHPDKNRNKETKSKTIFLHSVHVDKPETKRVTYDILLTETEEKEENHRVISLEKHFSSYREIKQKFSEQNGGHPIFGSSFVDSYFIIYTNASASPSFTENENIIKTEDADTESIFDFDGGQDSNSYYEIVLGSDEDKQRKDMKSVNKSKERIINILQNSSECRRLAKALANAVFPSKGDKEAEIVHQGILQKYHFPLSETVILRNISNRKTGKFRASFIDGDNSLSQQDSDFRNDFFEEAEKITKKSETDLKNELESKTIKLSEKFGNKAETEKEKIRYLPGDHVNENEIQEFLSKLKLLIKQPGESHLTDIIKEKIRLEYGVEHVDVNTIFSDVKAKLEQWWKEEEKCYLTEKTRFFQDSIRISISFDVQRPVELFTGRKQELSCIHNIFQPQISKDCGKTQMVVVTGLAGTGKTELARQYINLYSQSYDNNIIWINAETYGTLCESFRRLAQTRLKICTKNIEGKEKSIQTIVEEIYQYFSKRKSLFIFDDAKRYKTHEKCDSGIDKFLPHFLQNSKVYVLITSLSEEWDNLNSLPLHPFSADESKRFIRNALNIPQGEQESEIEKLSATLQYFPLTLQQAAAYIREEGKATTTESSELTIKKFLAKYKESNTTLCELLDYKPVTANNYYKTTYATLKTVLQKIAKISCGDEALRILSIMSYICPNNIPTKMFMEMVTDKKKIRSALQLLKCYSVIRLENTEANIHKLVQQVVRVKVAFQNKEKDVLIEALNLFRKVMPDKINCNYASHAMSVWSYTTKYEELVKDFSMIPNNIMHELYISVRYKEACLFGHAAILLLESVLVPDHIDTLLLMSNTAGALDWAGKYDEALKVYEIVLGRCANKFGTHNFRTLKIQSSMAATLNTVGRYNEALEAFREIRDTRKEMLGEDHPDTLSAMNNVATVLVSLHRNCEGLEIYEVVLKKRILLLGSDHLDTLTSMHDMATAYHLEGKYDQALELFEEVLQKRRKILGPENPVTMLTNIYMTAVLHSKQSCEDAVFNYQDLMEKTERIFGPDHFLSFTVKNGLAQVLYDQRKYADALVTCEQILKTGKKILGRDHCCILETQDKRAAILCQQGKYNEAYAEYKDLLERRSRVWGSDHRDTLTTMERIACVLSTQGNFRKALRAFREVLKEKVQTLGTDHTGTILTEYNIAALLGKQGCYQEALEANQKVLNKAENILEPGTLHISIILMAKTNIAAALGELGNHDEAFKIYTDLFNETKQVNGPNHYDTLAAKVKIANELFRQGKYDESLLTLEDILDKGKQMLGPEHPDNVTIMNSIATVLDVKGYHHMASETYQEVFNKEVHVDTETLETQRNIAVSLYNQGKYEESLTASYAVLDKIQSELGPMHPSVILSQINIARALRKQGKCTKSLETYEEILKNGKEILGPNHPDILDIMNDIAEVLDEQGNYDESLKIYEEVLQKRTKIFGPDHLTTLDTKNNMARVYVNQGRLETALEIYYEVFKKTKRILGPDSPSTLATQNNIASVLVTQGHYKKALKIYRDVLEKRTKTFAQSHPDTLNTMSNIAGILGRQNNFGSALKLYNDVLRKREIFLGHDHPDTLSTKHDIAGILFKQGKCELALETYHEVLDQREKKFGCFHRSVLSTETKIAAVLSSQEKYKEALPIYENILHKSKQILGIDDRDTLAAMGNLATALYNCGESEFSLEIRKRLLDKAMNILGRNDPLTLHTMYKLVEELDVLERHSEVIETYLCVMNKEEILELYNRDPFNIGNDVLHKLACEGRLEVLKHLVDNGADVLKKNEHDTLLHQAVRSDNKDVMKLILDKVKEQCDDIGPHIDAPDEEGDTPLMWAAETGKSNAAQLLLNYGANVHVKNTNNQTALHWAAKGGYQDIVELLLSNRARSDIKDINGLTALDLAYEKLKCDVEILKQVRSDFKTVMALLSSTSVQEDLG